MCMRTMVGSHLTTIFLGQKRIVYMYFNLKGLMDFIALAECTEISLSFDKHTHSTTCDMKTIDIPFHMQKGDEKFSLWKQNQGNTMLSHAQTCTTLYVMTESIEKESYKGNTVTMCMYLHVWWLTKPFENRFRCNRHWY